MKGARVKYWLAATTPVAVLTLLLMLLFVLTSSYFPSVESKNTVIISGGSRKLLSPSSTLNSENQMRSTESRSKRPLKQAQESFRKIPPSTSNPTQNKSRPRIDPPRKA